MVRRIIFFVLFACFIWFVIKHRDQLTEVLHLVQNAQWMWLLLALISEVAYLALLVILHQYTFRSLGMEKPLHELTPLVIASLCINVIAPTANTAGAALFAHEGKMDGHSGVRTTIAVMLAVLLDIISFFLILIVGFSYLSLNNELNAYEIAAGMLFSVILLVFSLILVLGWHYPKILSKLIKFSQKWINHYTKKFHKGMTITSEWTDHVTQELQSASESMKQQTRVLEDGFGIASLAHVAHIAVLFTCCLAFGVTPTFGILITGYVISVLFMTISPTPQGMGIVEGAMALIFTSQGMNPAQATIIPIVYRGIMFWLPLLTGFILLRTTKAFRKPQIAEAT